MIAPRLTILCCLTLLAFFYSDSQTVPWSCADDQIVAAQKQFAPSYEKMQKKVDIQIRDYVSQVLKNRKNLTLERTMADTNFTIPVVVHVIHPEGEEYGTGTNISYAQIRSQIEALNAAFSKSYPTYNGQSHPLYAQDSRIRFCLARKTNSPANWAQGPGGTEFGVVRYGVSGNAYHHNISIASAQQLLDITHPSSSTFPFDKYLNIWLVKTIGGGNSVMGYAPRPIMGTFPIDGIVIRADIFGDNNPANSYPLNFGLTQGKILVHEMGHYLNLYHIFQGGCAGANPAGSFSDACDLNGDMICDIEPATTQNILCGAGIPNTCTANYDAGTTSSDMINNYMSYADDNCMNTFTLNQAERMWATLHLQRYSLWQSSNFAFTGVLGNDGCIPPYLNAQINTNNGVFCAGGSVLFSNPDQGNTATSHSWQFPGATPSSSLSDTVTVSFPTPGNYKAILEVSDGVNTRKDSMIFTVVKCELDSSLKYMAHWYFGYYGSIDFTSGAPVQTNTALANNTIRGEQAYAAQTEFVQGTVSLSDSSGNLLFYSNGVSVWNKDHQKISTTPIFGASDINASTGICYVPYPGKPGKYFIVGASANLSVTPDGLRVVEVDLNTNTVSSYRKFQHPTLEAKLSEMMTVVPHCNGTDYWIIAHGYHEDTRFYSFLVNEAGVDHLQAPVISESSYPAYQGSGNQLKSNRSGTKLVLASPHSLVEDDAAGALYDFNTQTGQATAERKIPGVPGYNSIQTGAAFSPNEEYLYLFRSSNLQTNGLPYWLFQYRVSDLAYNIIPAPGFYFCAPMQPGPDNKIYVTMQNNYVSRISNPDEWGNVGFQGNMINMMAMDLAITTGVSIPCFIDARKPLPEQPDFRTTMLDCDSYRFTTICLSAYDFTWDYGDGSQEGTGNTVEHHYLQSGEYDVTLKVSSGGIFYGSVTKKVKVLLPNTSVTGPDIVCTSDNHPSQYFAPIVPGANYKWTATGGSISGPDNLPFVDVQWPGNSTAGTVKIKLTRQGCVVNASKNVFIMKGPDFNWVLPDSVCVYDSAFVLNAHPQGGSYDGPGVSNGKFSPSIAGVGNHVIRYVYGDEVTCLGQIEKTIKVRECNIPVTGTTPCDIVLNNIQIAPNPVEGVLRFKSLYVLNLIQVYNSAGQKVAGGHAINNRLQLPVLAAGIYYAMVFCDKDNSYRSFKFLKL